MKIKSYHILFRIFSYLSDKTNGAPLFVKYKLLLGTLILGVTTSLANSGSKAKMVNDTIPTDIEEKLPVTRSGMSIPVEAPKSHVIMTNLNSNPITVLCYGIVVVQNYHDDIYNNAPKIITKMSYFGIQIRPISPVGNLDNFQNWMDQQVRYNERMLKDKVEGNVILRFAIDKNGKVVNAKVIQKLSPDADAEALRVLTSSGRWTPGRQYDKAIKTTMIRVTVHFKLPEK